MKPEYVPILRVKRGELTAVTKLTRKSARKILPLFDIPTPKDGTSTLDHLDKVAQQLANAWGGAPILLDAFFWLPNAIAESGEHVLTYAASKLGELGTKVMPIAGYDRWDDDFYRAALTALAVDQGLQTAIRIDFDGIEEASDEAYFQERVSEILNSLNQNPSETMAILDFADMTHISVEDAVSRANTCLSRLAKMGFSEMVIAGSSIPPSIDSAVRQPDHVGLLTRKEMLAWQALTPDFPTLTFGDYGVRSPRAADDIIAPDANGKIRYTIARKFFIARGHSLRRGTKFAQYYDLARRVIDSEYFMGEEFSWGDQEIAKCANKLFKGNSTTWISIDSNHHMTSVLAEVFEFRQRVEREAQG